MFNHLTREHELLFSEIERIVKGCSQENDDGFDCEAGYAAFKHDNELCEKRMNLKTEQATDFSDEQRVAGESTNNRQQEEIVAPTLTRSLGEDFLLQ